MKVGWFSMKMFESSLALFEDDKQIRNFCVYSKPNGNYAVTTSVGEITGKAPKDAQFLGEVGECLVNYFSRIEVIDRLDHDKLASAAIEVGVSLEEVLGKVSKKPPIKITPALLEKLQSIGSDRTFEAEMKNGVLRHPLGD